MLKFAFIFTLLIADVMAAGDAHGGHHPTMKDLIAPTFNFVILFGFLLYKIKAPMKSFFDTKSKKISEILDRAQVKSKEAQVLFDLNTRKVKEADHDAANILKAAEEDAKKFAQDCDREAKDKTEKLKSEAFNRVEAEKKVMINQLNKELVDEVILKSKKIIATDNKVKTDLTTKAVKEIAQ